MKTAFVYSTVTTLVVALLCLGFVDPVSAQGGGYQINQSVINAGGRSGGGTFTIDGTIGQPVAGVTSTGGTFNLQSGFWAGGEGTIPSRRSPFDFDGDGKADIAVFRPAGGIWFINRSSNGVLAGAQFGLSTDKIVPGDFTGDGKADIAVWRPSTGQWYVLRSEDGVFFVLQFGSNGDRPGTCRLTTTERRMLQFSVRPSARGSSSSRRRNDDPAVWSAGRSASCRRL